MISRIFNPLNGAVPAQEAQLILDWINALLGTKFTTLMQLRNGSIWCELLGMLFPDHIELQHINFCKKDERRFCKNFKLLKMVFKTALTKREMRLKELLLVHHGEFMQMLRFFQELFMRYSSAEQRMRCARSIDFERVKQLSQQGFEQLGELNVCTLMKLAQELGLLETLQKYGQQQQQQEKLALATFGWPQFVFKCCRNEEQQRAAEEMPQQTRSRSAARRRLCENMQVVGLVCKALRWSPTSRRNYVLPQRVLPLRQNLGDDYYDCLCNARQQQQLQRRHKRKKRKDQQMTKDVPRK